MLNNPGAIFPYSVGDWIAQTFHSAECLNSGCTPTSNGVVCTPIPPKNQFGCDEHGTMTPRKINGVAPTVGSGTSTAINSAFPSTFDRILFAVVPYDPNTTDHIPGPESDAPGGVNLEALFGAAGWICTNATAKADITAYGFINISTCGITS